MVAAGTRVELVNMRMMNGNSPARPADPGSRTSSPSQVFSAEKARPTPAAKVMAPRAAAGPA